MAGFADDEVRAAVRNGRLDRLPAGLLDRLTASARLVSTPARALVPFDPEAQFTALVVRGLLRTYISVPDGRQITLRYSRPGALVGVASLYARSGDDVGMQALVDTRLLLMQPATVRRLAGGDPAVAHVLLLELGERTTAYMRLVADTSLSSVRQNVVRHLFDLAVSDTAGDGLVARLTQQQLADHVGTVREVVARILRELRAEGLISTARDEIVVHDPLRLHAIVWPGNE